MNICNNCNNANIPMQRNIYTHLNVTGTKYDACMYTLERKWQHTLCIINFI